MPELPEVETIKRGLKARIVGKAIRSIKVLEPKCALFNKSDEKFAISEISKIKRRGKVLILNLASGYSLMFHLKMTGQIVFDGAKQEKEIRRNREYEIRFAGGHPTSSMAGELPDKSTRVIFELDDGSKLFFNDQRKFGWVKIVPTKEIVKDSLIKKMGPEPEKLTDKQVKSLVKNKIKNSSRMIKSIILDQNIIAGVGNIYADEALFFARIHPETRGRDLTEYKIDSLLDAVTSVLKTATGHGGTSFTNYVKVDGAKGRYLEKAWVFRREGNPCKRCGATIKKIRVGARGTHYCPNCQIK